MQWLIDAVFDFVMKHFKGMILIWSGAIVDIPDGWVLCDGNNGTPDLRDKFVIGAEDTYNPDATGGSVNHTHDFTGDGHIHEQYYAPVVEVHEILFVDVGQWTRSAPAVGTTDADGSLPPYYALAYIMKT